MATEAPSVSASAMGISRRFTSPDQHPYDAIEWSERDARITEPGKDGGPELVVFEQTGCEFPAARSDTAVRIVAAPYLRHGRLLITSDAAGDPLSLNLRCRRHTQQKQHLTP